jgi:hypothetical protein
LLDHCPNVGSLRGSILIDDKFKIVKILVENRVKQLRKQLCPVISRDADGKNWSHMPTRLIN